MLRQSNFRLLLRFSEIRWLLLGNCIALFVVVSLSFFYYLPLKSRYSQANKEYRIALDRYKRLQRNADFFEQVEKHKEYIERVHKKISRPYHSSSVVEQIGSLVNAAGLTVRREKYSEVEYMENGVWEVSGRLGMVGGYIQFADFVKKLDTIKYMALVEKAEIKAKEGDVLSISVELRLYGEAQ